MMQSQKIYLCTLLLICCIAGIMCNCSPYVNKVYQVAINFPNFGIFYAAVTFESRRLFNAQVNVAASLSGTVLSDITGYYKCPNRTFVKLSGIAYYSQDPNTPYLKDDGAIGLIEFDLNFSKNWTTCQGRSRGLYFKTGSNPFDPKNMPVFIEPYSTDTCVLFKGPKRP